MRRRSSAAITFGGGTLVGSWAFGSTPLAVVGLGFVLAGLLARGWSRVAGASIRMERRIRVGEHLEGGDVAIGIHVRRRRRVPYGSVVLRQRLGSQVREIQLSGTHATILFTGVHRGRHQLDPLELSVTDPLGLERIEHRLDEPTAVLVRPRIPELRSVFSSQGAREAGAGHSRFRRPTGFDIHAVRDYQPGEPLRSVHWPSTARRGSLMVRELDDTPRDEIAIVLDQDADGVAGPPGQWSFDAAVRAAGAIALVHLHRNRRVVIVGSRPGGTPVSLRTAGSDWEFALDALAAVMPASGARVDRLLRDAASVVSRAREIVVVTGRPDRAVDALLELRRGGRSVALVAVASETFAGRPRAHADPALLRAAAQGVAVCVVSADGPLECALSAKLVGAAGA